MQKTLDSKARKAIIVAAVLFAIGPIYLAGHYIVSQLSDRAEEKELQSADRDVEIVTLPDNSVELVGRDQLANEVEDWLNLESGGEQTILLAEEGFEEGSVALKADARRALAKLVSMLKADGRLTAQLIYDVEGEGAAGLEKGRAEQVVAELVNQGAPPDRVASAPFQPDPDSNSNSEEEKGLRLVLTKG